MGYKLQHAVWPLDLGLRDKLVLMAFASFARDGYGDECYPSHETIARMCGVQLRVVERAVMALKAAGYLKVVHKRYRDEKQRRAGAPFRRLYHVVVPGVTPPLSDPTRESGDEHPDPTRESGDVTPRPDTSSAQTRHFGPPDPTPGDRGSIRDPSRDPSSDPSTEETWPGEALVQRLIAAHAVDYHDFASPEEAREVILREARSYRRHDDRDRLLWSAVNYEAGKYRTARLRAERGGGGDPPGSLRKNGVPLPAGAGALVRATAGDTTRTDTEG